MYSLTCGNNLCTNMYILCLLMSAQHFRELDLMCQGHQYTLGTLLDSTSLLLTGE